MKTDPLSLASRVLEHVDAHGPIGPAEVARKLCVDRKAVSNAMEYLHRRGRVERLRHGLYAATDPKVVYLDVDSKLDLPPDRVLQWARAADLTEVLVVGREKSGQLYIASSMAGGPELLWLLERTRAKLINSSRD